VNAEVDRPLKIIEPRLRMDPITPERYISREYARLEWSRMWMRTWHIGGMAYQAPEPGDYLVADLGAESIIIVRQEEGRLRAFYNVCVHRGTRLLAGPDGHAAQITCPYHGWQFNHAGRCTFVPDAGDFPKGDPTRTMQLTELRCEELFGLVWFTMDANAPPLRDYLGPAVVSDIGAYRMEEMVRVLNMSAQADCNWKIITDNFNEAYHVQVLHPQLAPYIESFGEACQFDLLENGHNRGWFPAHRPGTKFRGASAAEPLVSLMSEWGLDAGKYTGDGAHERIRLDIQRQKRKLGPSRGFEHYERLADFQLTDYIIYNLFPNSVLTVGPDGVQLLRPRPHPSDPEKCLFDHWWMVPRIKGRQFTPSPAGGPDLPVEDAPLELIRYGEKTLGTTSDQDLSIAAIQQVGLHSAGFVHHHLCHQERRVQNFHERLNDYLGAPAASAAAASPGAPAAPSARATPAPP
jgi:phenylpropionate dioxygenase-like ring-hydroxylating dioxygenase large terminal subunit